MQPVLSCLLFSALFSWVHGQPPLVIAHRGASGYLPEHTLAAKAYAHAVGADYLEQDLVLSKDGVPVVLHDIEIDHVTDVAQRFPDRKRADGHYYAIDFALAEIRQLRVTERLTAGGVAVFPRRFPPWQGSFTVSTLEEELQFIQGLNRSTGRSVGIYVELKAPAWHRAHGQDLAAVVLPILARYGYRTKADPCFVQCFDFEEIKRCRAELHYMGRLVLLGGDQPDEFTPERLAEVAHYADGIGPAIGALVTLGADGRPRPNEVVARAHALGLVVHPYTFRADALPAYATSADEFLELFFNRVGVDGIFADQPDLPRTFLAKQTAASSD